MSSRLSGWQCPLLFERFNNCKRAKGSAKNFLGRFMCLISRNYFLVSVQNQSKQSGMIPFVTGSTDTILAAQTAAIAAKSLGIDSMFTNGIHRGNMNRVYELLDLPEKYCFPLLSVCLGYPAKESPYLKGRVKNGVIHYNKYQRLSPEEIDEVIAEYDDEEKHFTTMTREQITREGFEHYLDLSFSRWKGNFPKEQIKDCYTTLKKVGFFKVVD